MLGKLLVFQGRYEEALSEAFSGGSQMVEEEINSLLHLDTGGSIDDGEGRRDRTLDDLVPPDETGTVVGATSLTASSNGGDQGGSAPSLSGPFRLPSAVALQTLLCLGLALEQMGRAKDALLPYSDVTGHCRRLPNRDRLLNSTGLSFFVGLAMYRYGMLCSALAIDPRSLQGTGPFTSAASTGQLREQLLSDAALSLRMFLSFKPRIFGSLRHRAAATSYWEVLEARFRQISYRKAFACSTARLEHGPMMMQATTTIPSRDLAVSMALEINGPFCPGSYAEDMLLGVQLMEALTPLPTDAEGAQKGGLSRTVQVSIARLARREDWPGLASYCQGLLIKYAADATAYGRLVLANAAAGRLAEVIRAGEIYVDLGGIEPSTLLIIARANMLLPGRASHAVRILERQLGRAIAVSATSGHGDGSGGHSSHIHSPPSPHTEPTKEGGEGTGKGTEHRSPPTSLGNALRVTLGAAYLRCAMVAGCSQAHSRDLIEQAVTILAEAVIQDETDARPHYWLALAYALQRRLRPAEDCIKTALSLESEMPVAWFLFALIASARKDYDLCLSICNSYQEGHPVLFIPYAGGPTGARMMIAKNDILINWPSLFLPLPSPLGSA